MQIIIFDHLGCHASVLAGSCLTGLLESKSSTRDILNLAHFGCYQMVMPGLSFYIGRDKTGNEIYTLGVGQEAKPMTISVHDMLEILGTKSELKIIDVSIYNTLFIRLLFYIGLLKPLKKSTRYVCALLLKSHLSDLCLFLQRELCD